MERNQVPLPTTLEDAETQLSNAVYDACKLIEDLEGVGLVWGNGHHQRQNVARFAMEQLRKQWRAPKPTPEPPPALEVNIPPEGH